MVVDCLSFVLSDGRERLASERIIGSFNGTRVIVIPVESTKQSLTLYDRAVVLLALELGNASVLRHSVGVPIWVLLLARASVSAVVCLAGLVSICTVGLAGSTWP